MLHLVLGHTAHSDRIAADCLTLEEHLVDSAISWLRVDEPEATHSSVRCKAVCWAFGCTAVHIRPRLNPEARHLPPELSDLEGG